MLNVIRLLLLLFVIGPLVILATGLAGISVAINDALLVLVNTVDSFGSDE